MPEWRTSGIEDDIRPRMFALTRAGEAFALATIAAADGGPRPVGSQMVVTEDASWGFLSGGCIEDDVARNAREVLAEGTPRHLIYGRGSPYVDIRLPCGGRLEVLVERIAGDDSAVRSLDSLTRLRQSATWRSDGYERVCIPVEGLDSSRHWPVQQTYAPYQRLLVVGGDPVALALAGLGHAMGWETVLLAPFGPADTAPFGVACDRRPLTQSLSAEMLDRWTAVAVATHGMDADEPALVAALASDAGYVGVLGARRKLAERGQRLADAGVDRSRIARLHAPIGLDIGAGSPWEIAVSVVGQIIQERQRSALADLSAVSAGTRVAA